MKIKLAKTILILIGFILCLDIYKHYVFWPIITWPMYSSYSPKFPDSTTTALQLRVISQTDQVHTLPMSEPLLMDGEKVIQKLINNILTSRDKDQEKIYSNALINLIQYTLPDVDIKNIEVWEMKWEVSPFSVPPFDRDSPIEKNQILSLNIAS